MSDNGLSLGGGRGSGFGAGSAAPPPQQQAGGPSVSTSLDSFLAMGGGGAGSFGVLGIPNPANAGFGQAQGPDGTPVYLRPSGALAYLEGDAAVQVTNMSTTELKKIQQVMSASGLLTGNVQYGMPDSPTIRAYEQVLMLSNRLDVSPMVVLGRLGSSARDMMLAEMEKAAAEQRSSGPTRAPFVAQVSNPEELSQFFREAVVERLGSLPEGLDLDTLVDAYQAVQRNAQAAAYNAAPSGGTVEQAMSPDAFVQSQLEEQAPQQLQSNDVVERAGQLFNMLGSFGGQ